MWRNHKSQNDLRAPPALGLHGMSKNRFKHLRSLVGQMWPSSEDGEAIDDTDSHRDMWRFCRLPVDEFNLHYEEVFVPGSLTGPDESMCPWEGAQDASRRESIPHSHFVPRKPKDTGAELNTQADGQCGGIYRIDIERGASDPYPREFEQEWGYTTALNFRLAKTIFNSGRIFAGDSRFMSVDAIEDLHMKGLYGIGDVKTRTSRYPVKKIVELCGPQPGDWSVMSTSLDDGFKVYAIGHRRGGEVHTFVASCGLTVAGKPQQYSEDVAVYGTKEPRKCPKVLNTWSQQQPKIDKNNRFRQDILAIEERFVTKSFPFRMLTTIIGITFANAFEWFNYFIDKTKYAEDGFIAFMRDLCYDGMHNKFDSVSTGTGRGAATPSRHRQGDEGHISSPTRQSPRTVAKLHALIPIRSLPNYHGYRKQLCAVCQDQKHKTSWCCAFCSDAHKVFGMHPVTLKHRKATIAYDCMKAHLAEPDNKKHAKHCAIPTHRPRSGVKHKRKKKKQKRQNVSSDSRYVDISSSSSSHSGSDSSSD